MRIINASHARLLFSIVGCMVRACILTKGKLPRCACAKSVVWLIVDKISLSLFLTGIWREEEMHDEEQNAKLPLAYSCGLSGGSQGNRVSASSLMMNPCNLENSRTICNTFVLWCNFDSVIWKISFKKKKFFFRGFHGFWPLCVLMNHIYTYNVKRLSHGQRIYCFPTLPTFPILYTHADVIWLRAYLLTPSNMKIYSNEPCIRISPQEDSLWLWVSTIPLGAYLTRIFFIRC